MMTLQTMQLPSPDINHLQNLAQLKVEAAASYISAIQCWPYFDKIRS